MPRQFLIVPAAMPRVFLVSALATCGEAGPETHKYTALITIRMFAMYIKIVIKVVFCSTINYFVKILYQLF